MARKDADGVKHSKKSNAKENRKKNIYSQKAVRNKEAVIQKTLKCNQCCKSEAKNK